MLAYFRTRFKALRLENEPNLNCGFPLNLTSPQLDVNDFKINFNFILKLDRRMDFSLYEKSVKIGTGELVMKRKKWSGE